LISAQHKLPKGGEDASCEEKSYRDLLSRVVELENANAVYKGLIRSLSHDMRTPLTAIIGLSKILQKNDAYREVGDNINDSCQHLICTLDSVLQLAQLHGSKVKITPEPVRLKAILENIRGSFDLVHKQVSGPRILIQIEDAHLNVMADYGALQRVLGNLVDNALKFCPDAPITVRAYRESNHVLIEVEDSGPGISERFLKKIFEPFSQDSRTRQTCVVGSGLGLSISHELVQLMKGSIEVETVLGEGTIMRVCLPSC
jgi:signal transduction histidine kinase